MSMLQILTARRLRSSAEAGPGTSRLMLALWVSSMVVAPLEGSDNATGDGVLTGKLSKFPNVCQFDLSHPNYRFDRSCCMRQYLRFS